jgi:hypothetical protein
MKIRLTLFAILGIFSIAAINGCKIRPSESSALADDTTNSPRRWNGRDCFFGSSMTSIKRLNYLSLGWRTELTAKGDNDWQSRQTWLRDGIKEGMKQITGNTYATAEAAIDDADEDTIWYQPIEIHLDSSKFPIKPVQTGATDTEPRFYLFEVSLGDNWNGFVVQVDRKAGGTPSGQIAPFKIVNKYSDGDTYDCDISRPTVAQRAGAQVPVRLCAFGEDTGYLFSSISRKNGVWKLKNTLTYLKDSSTLTDDQKRELVEGLDFYDDGTSRTVADLINETDDKEVSYREITYRNTGKIYRWYGYYGGDNPHGFIYGPDESGATRKVASIGDGSIDTCFVKKTRK